MDTLLCALPHRPSPPTYHYIKEVLSKYTPSDPNKPHVKEIAIQYKGLPDTEKQKYRDKY